MTPRAPRDSTFDDFVDARYRTLLRLAVWLVGQEGGADLLHEALARTLSIWRRNGPPDNPEAYVCRVMVNLSSRRRQRALVDIDSLPESQFPTASPEEGLEPDAVLALWRAISGLPRRQRTVVVLRYGAGLSEVATADVMNTSVGTVKSQQSKAIAKMRRDLDLFRAISEEHS